MKNIRNGFILFLAVIISTFSLIFSYNIQAAAQDASTLSSILSTRNNLPALTQAQIDDFDKYVFENKRGLLALDTRAIKSKENFLQSDIINIQKYLKSYNYKLNQVKNTQLQLVKEPKSFSFNNPEAVIRDDFNFAEKSLNRSKRCQRESKLFYKWWGDQLYLNHCLIKDLALKNLAGRVAAGVICSVLTLGLCAPIFAGLSTVISIYLISLRFNSVICSNKGANLNKSNIGLFWVSRVC